MIQSPQDNVPGHKPLGIRCPRCRSRNLKVLRTKLIEDGKLRRRKCKDCGFDRIFTSEVSHQAVPVQIVKAH